MPGMVFLAGLALDEVSHPGSRPQARAIPQDFRSFGQATTQGGQLLRVQAGLASRPACFLESLFALALPFVMPTSGRFPRDGGLASDFGLAATDLEKPSGFQTAPFQRLKVTSYTFRIAHARTIARQGNYVTILYEIQ
jgi:hypothetical protein